MATPSLVDHVFAMESGPSTNTCNKGVTTIISSRSRLVSLVYLCMFGQAIAAYECHGPLIDLGLFCNAEFFVAPPDFTWTMVHTHENHGFGGPYFIRVDWIL